MSAPVAEALDVIGRTAGWLGRDGGRNAARARYVENTLAPWAARVTEGAGDAPAAAALREAVTGFDAAPPEERSARVSRLVEALQALRASAPAVAPVAEPRAVLSPADIASALPPKIVVALPVAADAAALAAPVVPPSLVVDAVSAEARPGRESGGGERREGRRESRRDERPDDARAQGRGEGRGESRGDRRGERRGERRELSERAGAAENVSDAPASPETAPREVVVAPPPPAPEPAPPLSFPLGHPEGSGASLTTIGASLAEVASLSAVGIESVADLLCAPPAAHDRAGERLVDGVPPDGPVIVRGALRRRATRYFPAGRRHEAVVVHDRGELRCRWLGELPAELRAAKSGASVGLAGTTAADDDGLVLYEGEPLGIDGRGGDYFPRYNLPGIPEPRARALVRAALRSVEGTVQEHLPPEVIERHKLAALPATLRDVHFPSNVNRRPRQRMAFDELLQIQLGIALSRNPDRRERAVAVPASHEGVSRALAMAGWQFSDAQEAAFDAIRRDLRRPVPMDRLLQGEVGSGKGAVVRAAMTLVAEAKQAVFFCAADARSAEHHHVFALEWFRSLGIEPLLLVGPPNRVQAEAIRKGETLVIYGTHALLESPPEAKRVGLVVVEESGHYFVPDMATFTREGSRPHLLVNTPTPVPAVLALTVFGQLAVTVVDAPAGHGVETQVLAAAARDEAYAAAREALAQKRQVIVVLPFGPRGTDLLSPSEARRMAEVLEGEALKGARIAIFSGGLTAQERFRAYDDFQHRRVDVLFATTAFEEGPIVPNAAVLIAEYAEQFDLVRMHRLRNHVANGFARTACFFVRSEEVGEESAAAMELITRETDGFRVADLDVSRRGVEAVLGPEAADVPRFAWAEPAQDRETLLRARAEAFRLLALDPGLRRRSHRALANLVRARFGEEVQAGDAPPPGSAVESQGGGSRKRRRRRR